MSVPVPSVVVVEAVDDITRILNLPRRQPVDCVRDSITRQYAPATQALIEVVTARFARPRLSCACRPRKVLIEAGGAITVFRLLPEGDLPEIPLRSTVRAFVEDCDRTNVAEATAAKTVLDARPGEEVLLPAANGDFGYPCITELNAPQAWALWELPKIGGGLGMCGCGSGKSYIFMLLPLAFLNCRVAVVLIEPNQRQHYLSQYLRMREHFRAPTIVFDDALTQFRVPGAPVLHVVPYSKIGNPNAPEILDLLDPDVLGADEGHRLAGKNDSTTKRRQRRFIATHPNVRFFPASGTLEDKSASDTQPLATAALGMKSPLPLDPDDAKALSLVVDPSNRPDRTSMMARRIQDAFGNGAIDPYSVSAILARSGVDDEIRVGFCQRRIESYGVISANAAGTGVPNYMTERKAPKIPKAVLEALVKVRDEGLRPDGDIILGKDEDGQAMQVRVAREVASGFYYFWRFTGNKCTCPTDVDETDRRCAGCLLIDDWFEKRKKYGKELRSRLQQALPHLDSQKLCMNAAVRALEDQSCPDHKTDVYCVDCRQSWPCGKKTHLPAWRSEFWKDWGEIRFRVPHVKCVEWIDDFLARDAAKWATENRGVVWYASTAFGQKVAELAGINCHGGGPGSEEAIRAENGKKSIVASLKAYGKGLDGLQLKYNRQLLLEMPSSNRIVEQWLGRLDREGQRADEVYTEYYTHVTESRDALRKVLARAQFNQTMTKNMQKILMADGDWK